MPVDAEPSHADPICSEYKASARAALRRSGQFDLLTQTTSMLSLAPHWGKAKLSPVPPPRSPLRALLQEGLGWRGLVLGVLA